MYRSIFISIPDVIFDLSEAQLKSKTNGAWEAIRPGSIACVIASSRKVSAIYKIDAKMRTDVFEDSSRLHVITGKVVGRLPSDVDMQTLLKRFSVDHRELPGNTFSIGFNLTDLGGDLDALEIKTRCGTTTVGELKRKVGAGPA